MYRYKKGIMKHLFIYIALFIGTISAFAGNANDGTVKVQNVNVQRVNDRYNVTMQMVLDELHVTRNHQLFVTPYFESGDGSQKVMMPTIVFSGRNMHYVYLRSGKTKATGKTNYNIREEIYHKPGTSRTIDYSEVVALQPWMQAAGAHLAVAVDTCGCGLPKGQDIALTQDIYSNPAGEMLVMPFPRPEAKGEGKIIAHNGRARVQFEVNKTELHEVPYVCKSGQRIDNRKELKVIADSIQYAISNPNVEIASIMICGYASPESPYTHNQFLATNRSRSLSEYIGRKYQLPMDRCTYTSVPENWNEFRQQVVDAKDITEQQRKDLLSLIDRPATTPSEFDLKETELKTSPAFAELYKGKILPQWFPQLRCTEFTINTHLKPMTDLQLREVLKKNPELMSLNEIYRVAGTYEHGSKEWHDVMAVALREFPEDPIANTNAAALAIERQDYDMADLYLKKAGNADDANILRGIVATYRDDYAAAREFFTKAKNAPEAQRNLKLISDK